MEAGADVNMAFDDDGRWLPLDLAFIWNMEMVEILHRAGSRFSSDDSALDSATFSNIENIQQGAGNLIKFCTSRLLLSKPLPASKLADVSAVILQSAEFREIWNERSGGEGLSAYKACWDLVFLDLSDLAQRDSYSAKDYA